MPKRRAEDAVHTVMTDHYIQRRRPAGDLLAPRKESDNFEQGAYRGEVVSYYPVAPAPTPTNELYLAVAQVQQGSNLTAGIARLEQAIGRHKPARAEFYYELARAHGKSSNHDAGCPLGRRGPAARRRLRAGAQGARRRRNAVRQAPGGGARAGTGGRSRAA